MKLKKLLFLLTLTLLFWGGGVSPAFAYLDDTEESLNNQLNSAVLDLEVSSDSDFSSGVIPDRLTPDQDSSRNIDLSKTTISIPLWHKVSYQAVGATDSYPDLCNAINLNTFYDATPKYTGPLSALSDFTDADFFIDSSTPQHFVYSLSLGTTDPDLQNRTCKFNLVFSAWQELSDGTWGFVDEEILENTISSGDWQNPLSAITATFSSDAQSGLPLIIGYTASDNIDIDYVQLCYSFDLNDWNCDDPNLTDIPSSPGSFNFNAPEGDGLYYFATIAYDKEGNQENKDLPDPETIGPFDFYSVQIDTQNPYTVLSLGEFGDTRNAQGDQLNNGNFDNDSFWTWAGAGQHQLVNNTDLSATSIEVKSPDNSALVGWLNDPVGTGGQDYTYQILTLPADTPSTLSFWYRVVGGDHVDNDYFQATIIDDNNPSGNETIITTGSDEIGGWYDDTYWQEITHSLSGWSGQSIRLHFSVDNNPSSNTFALIDNVRVTASPNYININNQIVLNSNDTGAGVEKTFYKTGTNAWQEYSTSFNLASQGVNTSDTVLLSYYSTDLVGNTETVRTIELTAFGEIETPPQPQAQITVFSPMVQTFTPILLTKAEDPNQDRILITAFIPQPKFHMNELVWLKNTQSSPDLKAGDNPSDDKFQPVDITEWQICHTDSSLPKYDENNQEQYNPTPTPDECVKIEPKLNPDQDPDDKKTEIPTEKEIILIADFKLDDDKDTIFLLDKDNNIIDQYSYEYKEDNTDPKKNHLFTRDPNDDYSWKDPEQKDNLLEYYLYSSLNQDKDTVNFKLYGMPDKDSYQLELLYLSEKLEKGVYTFHDFDSNDPDIIKEDMFMGTCSTDGLVCTPDPLITNINYIFTLHQGENNQILKNEIN
ncbi:hypothetical protein KKC08_04640 [Patescibacteria group bacterium]|nr:hypothetical protein [Patescibacteria group bacterium]MCG2702368.1 hypothetical protein [Candidatus Parcubacteria bacterium]MBU4389732.1 hypothetical protein [Patescibacteria group bacterium]MBU4397427.1 hypothetical protein [Patescibacteria group bacterium]MBU4431242.1 hypothetical protein [Patescibacteria group bacterium]